MTKHTRAASQLESRGPGGLGRWLVLPLLATLVGACAPDAGAPEVREPEALRTQEQASIYGTDDRQDWYQVEDAVLADRAARSTVAFVDPGNLDVRNSQDVQLRAGTLRQTAQVCEGEAFADQITAAGCSATLIDDDLILTAGHCVGRRGNCPTSNFVIGYYMESATELATVTVADIYACREVVAHELSQSRSGSIDYAIIRLDRPATPRHLPVPVSSVEAPIRVGEGLTIIGFGMGLPAKVDTGGRVIDARANTLDYFSGTTDSFGGNSGSGVYDESGTVVGILVNGQQDWEYNGRCVTAVTYPESGTRFGGEGITYAWRAVKELCDSGFPSPRLCGTEAVCGDGICSTGETGVCEEDCVPTVPDGWLCDPRAYGASDGCDCACGVVDPDCADDAQPVIGCDEGQYCDGNAMCRTPGVDLPDGWECEESVYNTEDGCDCNCGAFDPDCADPSQTVFNCDARQVCSAAGVCVDPTTIGEPGEDTGIQPDAGDVSADGSGTTGPDAGGSANGRGASDDCSAASGGAGVGWLLLGVLGFRRRRQSSAATAA